MNAAPARRGRLTRLAGGGLAIGAVAVVAVGLPILKPHYEVHRWIGQLDSRDLSESLNAACRLSVCEPRQLCPQVDRLYPALDRFFRSRPKSPLGGAPEHDYLDCAMSDQLARLASIDAALVEPARRFANLEPLVFRALLLGECADLALPTPAAITFTADWPGGRLNLEWGGPCEPAHLTYLSGILSANGAGLMDIGPVPLEAAKPDSPNRLTTGPPLRLSSSSSDLGGIRPLSGHTYLVFTMDRESRLSITAAVEVLTIAPKGDANLRWRILEAHRRAP